MGLKSLVGSISHIKTQLQWQIVGELMYRGGTIIFMSLSTYKENKQAKSRSSSCNSFLVIVILSRTRNLHFRKKIIWS